MAQAAKAFNGGLGRNLLAQFSVVNLLVLVAVAIFISIAIRGGLEHTIGHLREHGQAMMAGKMIEKTDHISIPSLTQEARSLETTVYWVVGLGLLMLYGGSVLIVWKGWRTIGAQRRDLEEANRDLQDLARFPGENPAPVLRVKADGLIDYANKAAQPLLKEWGVTVGQSPLDEHRRIALDALGKKDGSDGFVRTDPDELLMHDEAACPVLARLDDPLRKLATEHRHLSRYLHSKLGEQEEVPRYLETLEFSMKGERLNVIYPTNDAELFVHVYPNEQGGRGFYVAIEPNITQEVGPLRERIDTRLLDLTDDLGGASTKDEKRETLLRSLEQIVAITDRPGATQGDKTVSMYPAEYEALRYTIVRDKIELGALEPLMHDPYLEDVSTSGLGPI